MTDAPETTRNLHVLSSHQTDLEVLDPGSVSLPDTNLHVLSEHSTTLHLLSWGPE